MTAKRYKKHDNTNIQEVEKNILTKMTTTCKKAIEGLWFKGMRYANLVYENRILTIQQTQFNNETLINNLIDSYDRLVQEYNIEREMHRQKIISKLNSNAKDFTLVS